MTMVFGLAFFVFAAAPTPQSGAVYQESDGIVAIDLESSPPRDDWAVETAWPGYTGASYYTWRGADFVYGRQGPGTLTFKFRLTAPAKYHVRFHNRHAHPDRPTQDYMSWFIRFDGGEWRKTFSGPPREQWKWDTGFDIAGHPPAAVDLAAGLHTLDVAPLHQGVSLDRVHLFRDGVPGATGKTRPTSIAVVEGDPGPGPYGKLASLASKITRGQPLGPILKTVRSKLDGTDAEEAREARMILEAVTRDFQTKLQEALSRETQDPGECIEQLDLLAARLSGDELGAKAREESQRVQRDPKVQKELKAAAGWKRIEEIRGGMEPCQGSVDPSREEFRRRNAAAFSAVAAKCRALIKDHPETASAAKAQALLTRYR